MTATDQAVLGVAQVLEGQVLQRSGSTGPLRLVDTAGTTTVRVVAPDGAVVVDWSAADGSALQVPVGGPYSIDQRTSGPDIVRVLDEFFVGDLWLLGGQSNMMGSGAMRDLEQAHPLVRLLGMDRRWQTPVEPIHRLWDSPDPAHHGLFTPEQRATMDPESLSIGAGLGIAFGNELVAISGVPVGLLPAAQGGTSLAQWSPTRVGQPGETLYSSMLATARAAGGRVAGLLWYQGESDTTTDEMAVYVEGTRAVFDALRHDLGQPDLRVYLAQLGRYPITRSEDAERYWSAVRNAQLDLDSLDAQGVVATVDLPLSDPIHLDAVAQRRLGRRFARLVAGAGSTIQLASVTITGALVNWPEVMETMVVRLRFDGVTGGLSLSDHVPGFTVRDGDGAPIPSVWRAEVDPHARDTVVVTLAGPPSPSGDFVWYGYGTAPHCTLVDDADMAVPAFGPISLQPEWRTS